MKIISLGWGVQSFTMAVMVALRDLPPVDVAIHADTDHERAATYEFARRWTPWLEARGVKVVTVSNPQPPQELMGLKTDIPAFTYNGKTNGQLRRQCTSDWKIAPMRRWTQSHRNGEHVEQWIGISTDEALRMRPSDVQYITNRWPLIENDLSRKECVSYLQTHGLEVPVKSACNFCPYHSTKEWREVKKDARDWLEAVQLDRAIRKVRPPYYLYVHPARKPLEDVDLRTEQEKGQMNLWDEECTGLCGV